MERKLPHGQNSYNLLDRDRFMGVTMAMRWVYIEVNDAYTWGRDHDTWGCKCGMDRPYVTILISLSMDMVLYV